MLRCSLAVIALMLINLTAACYSPVPREEWPVRDDPLFRSTVWIEAGASLGSGVILHSSDRGTYVLTAGHMTEDEDSFLPPEAVVDVGVFALSHVSPVEEPYVRYAADVVATTVPRRPATGVAEASADAVVDQVSLRDFAVLRLRTDRRFLPAPLFPGSPEEVSDKPAVVVPVVPEMYPHRKPATCTADRVMCLTLVHGNSGAPVFVEGEIVGIASWLVFGPGPKKLQAFIRGHEKIRFLLAQPNASGGVAETPD
jgi:hypothetical protein